MCHLLVASHLAVIISSCINHDEVTVVRVQGTQLAAGLASAVEGHNLVSAPAITSFISLVPLKKLLNRQERDSTVCASDFLGARRHKQIHAVDLSPPSRILSNCNIIYLKL